MGYWIVGNGTAPDTIELLGTKTSEHPEVVIVWGGDGALLRAIREFASVNPLFIPVKRGNLGFFHDFDEADIVKLTNSKELHYVELPLAEVSDGTNSYRFINELALISPVHAQTFELHQGKRLIDHSRATGLVISNPWGTTGYAKSLGGALVEPGLKVFQISKIAPIVNNVSPGVVNSIIVSNCEELTISCGAIVASVDGCEVPLHAPLQVNITKQTIRLAIKEPNYWARVARSFIKEE